MCYSHLASLQVNQLVSGHPQHSLGPGAQAHQTPRTHLGTLTLPSDRTGPLACSCCSLHKQEL